MAEIPRAATQHHEFRPWFGRALTIAIGSIGVVSVIGFGLQLGLGGALRALPFFVAATGACWALFWRPAVIVDLSGVTIVNVTRTIRVPWPAIQLIDTKWSLTLVTAYGRFTAWAAPAPGAAHVVRSGSRREARRLPASTLGPDGIRPGDLPTSPSGEAALVIRQTWEALRDAGHLDDPKLEFERVPIEWHTRLGVVALLVSMACIVSLAL